MTEQVYEGTTHYPGCWQVHHECAVERIAVMDTELQNQGRNLKSLRTKHFELDRARIRAVEKLADAGNLNILKDRQIAALTAERDALKQENDHLCDDRNLGKCLEDMQPKDFAAATDDELKEAMEYCETCRCHICQWTRYELERRVQLAQLTKQVQK